MPCLRLLVLPLAGLLGVTSPRDTMEMFEEAVELHRQACTMNSECVTSDGTPNGTNPWHRKNCCGPCSCEADCFEYGTCCLHMYNNLDDGRQQVRNSRYSCVTPEYVVSRKPKDYESPVSEWMVSRCGEGWYPPEIIEKCESPVFDSSLQSLIPVTDTTTHIIYRNVFCTQCNRVNSASLKSWQVRFGCDRDLRLPAEDLQAQMYKSSCAINFIRVENTTHHECDVFYTISTCNETGHWQTYDELTNQACTSFVDPFNFTFKNYFCFLCNSDILVPVSGSSCKPREGKQFEDFLPSFSAIVDIEILSRWENDEILNCHETEQFEDYKLMKCWDIHCFGEERYLSDGECIFIENLNTNLCYTVFLKATPKIPLSYDTLKDGIFIKTLHSYLASSWPYAIKETEQIGFFVEEELVDQQVVRNFYLYVLLRTPELSGREQQQGVKDILTEIFETLQDEWLNFETKTENISLQVELSASTYSVTAQEIDTMSKGQGLSLPTGWVSVYVEQPDNRATCSAPKNVPLARKVMMCPYIIISLEELSYEIIDGVLIVTETGTKLRVTDYLEIEEEIFVCLEDYKSLYLELSRTANIVEPVIRSVEAKPTNILSFVCVCLSLVCLLVTLATYVFFRELQTQPGINTITLCVCLLLAQGMYQFGAGQTSLHSWACSLIGAFCHFLWLSVMFSMNVCSVQIYFTFIKSHTISPTYTSKQTAINTAYIVLASLLFVGINVIVSLIRSDGHEIGYGGIVCYLSTALMQGLTFLVPAAITLTLNIVLFCIVVYKITKTGQATSNLHQNKSYLLVYARLSALTGFTWILGFFHILFNNDVVEYLFILFNASQGVFVMIAFVLNQRVRNLFCPGLHQKRPKTLRYTASS